MEDDDASRDKWWCILSFSVPQDWAVCTSSRYVLQMASERRGWPCPLAGRLCSLGAASQRGRRSGSLSFPELIHGNLALLPTQFSLPWHHVCGRGKMKGENLRGTWEVSGIIWKYEVFSKINPFCQEGGGLLDQSLNDTCVLFLCRE